MGPKNHSNMRFFFSRSNMPTKRKAETTLANEPSKKTRLSFGFLEDEPCKDKDENEDFEYVDAETFEAANQTATPISKSEQSDAVLSDKTFEILRNDFNTFLDPSSQMLDLFKISSSTISSMSSTMFDSFQDSVAVSRYLHLANNYESIGELAFMTNFVRLFFPLSSEQFKIDTDNFSWVFYERGYTITHVCPLTL